MCEVSRLARGAPPTIVARQTRRRSGSTSGVSAGTRAIRRLSMSSDTTIALICTPSADRAGRLASRGRYFHPLFLFGSRAVGGEPSASREGKSEGGRVAQYVEVPRAGADAVLAGRVGRVAIGFSGEPLSRFGTPRGFPSPAALAGCRRGDRASRVQRAPTSSLVWPREDRAVFVMGTTLSQEWSRNSIRGPQCAFEMSMFMCPAVHKLTRN